MTVTTDTQQARLARAFETLKNKNITPLLILTGSTGTLEGNRDEYLSLAEAAGTADFWVGAHAGTEEDFGGHWVQGGLYHKATGHPVSCLWFSCSTPAVSDQLEDALEAQAFYTTRAGDELLLVLQESED